VLCTRIADITDGTSNTAMMSEVICQQDMGGFHGSGPSNAPAKSVEYVKAVAEQTGLRDNPSVCYTLLDGKYFAQGTPLRARRGVAWHDGQPHYVAFNTVLPPNGPSCAHGGNWGDQRHMVIPPTSRHPGGVNLLFADGSVDFISETIDTGNLGIRQPLRGMSVRGVWGAMGSKAGGDITE
jgi:prepilin-type processing-associated H-X9-DG protein